jgi:hypothetical protein
VEDFIEVDVFLPLAYAADDARWRQAFSAIAADIDGVGRIRLFYTGAVLGGDEKDDSPTCKKRKSANER